MALRVGLIGLELEVFGPACVYPRALSGVCGRMWVGLGMDGFSWLGVVGGNICGLRTIPVGN